MSITINLESIISPVGKYGKVTKNENGAYNVIVGAVEIYNTNGDFYEYTPLVRSLFAKGSPLMQRVEAGEVEIENNHPRPTFGMEEGVWLQRLLHIEKDNVCGVFRSITMDENTTTIPNFPKPVYLIRATVEPSGKLGNLLEKDLNDPSNDTAFSIRSFSNVRLVGPTKVNELKLIVTFDKVGRPGVPVAKKSMWSTLESCGMTVDGSVLEKVINDMKNSEYTSESTNNLITELGTVLTQCDDNSCIYNAY